MFSAVAYNARTVRKPLANVICKSLSSDPPRCLHHHGRANTLMNVFSMSARSKIICFNSRAYHKYALSISSCMPSIQQCQYSTKTKISRNDASKSKQTKSRPVRTENGSVGEEKLSFDNSNTEDVVADGSQSTNASDSERRTPQIMHRYTQAREKVQERIEQVKERENIFTIPNLLTISRIVLSPVLGYLVIYEYYMLAASMFVFTSATDVLDGWIARNFKNQQSVLGSIIDPLADKVLVSILTVSLTISGLIPVPLTVLIIGRDIGLITSVFWLRYKSLEPPKTLSRYFDLTHTTVQLKPTTISKYNTLIQVALVGFTLGAPVFNYVDHLFLHTLWYVTAVSTVMSGLSYVFLNDTFKYVRKGKEKQ